MSARDHSGASVALERERREKRNRGGVMMMMMRWWNMKKEVWSKAACNSLHWHRLSTSATHWTEPSVRRDCHRKTDSSPRPLLLLHSVEITGLLLSFVVDKWTWFSTHPEDQQKQNKKKTVLEDFFFFFHDNMTAMKPNS